MSLEEYSSTHLAECIGCNDIPKLLKTPIFGLQSYGHELILRSMQLYLIILRYDYTKFPTSIPAGRI